MKSALKKIRERISIVSSTNKKIILSFVWISLFVFLGKFAGAAKEVAVAWRYGVSETVDVYVFLYTLLSWPVSVWFSILTIVLLPLVANLKGRDRESLELFRSELLGLTILLGTVSGFFVWLVAPYVIKSGVFGFNEVSEKRALEMLGPMSLKIPLGFLVCLFSAWLMASGKHRNTLLEAIPALTLLAVLLMPIGLIPEPLVWGTVLGVSVQMLALAAPIHRSKELNAPKFSFSSPAWSSFWAGIGVMALGQTLTSATLLVDQFYAANLGVGAISSLNYANRALALFMGMGALAISRATLPVFSEARANGAPNLRRLAVGWSLAIFLAAFVIAMVIAIFSPLIVGLLFERGEFVAESTSEVSRLLRYAVFQLPFYCSALVLVSALAAFRKYHFIALSGAVNLFFKAVIAYFLVDYAQMDGLVLSTVAMYAVSLGVLYVLLAKCDCGVVK